MKQSQHEITAVIQIYNNLCNKMSEYTVQRQASKQFPPSRQFVGMLPLKKTNLYVTDSICNVLWN